jgi:hypothetical protein
MLKYDGTEDYLLDPNDYTKKADGSGDSDIANSDYEGNVMVGIPKVYWKIVSIDDDHANFYISDTKVDDNYHCWAHINNYGDEVPYMYMPAYNGSYLNSVIRSISGLYPSSFMYVQNMITFASANNQDDDNIWSAECYNDWLLINILLILISKSIDCKTVFGRGNNTGCTSGYTSATRGNGDCYNRVIAGSMDQKGLFWGSTNSNTIGVKIFGIENYWGNIKRTILGNMMVLGVRKIKLTYGTQDGSTVEGYNCTGDGYISISRSVAPITGDVGEYNENLYSGYTTSMTFNEYGIFIKNIKADAANKYYKTKGYISVDTTVSTVNKYNNYDLMSIGGRNYNGDTINGALLQEYLYDQDSHDDDLGISIKCLPKLATE